MANPDPRFLLRGQPLHRRPPLEPHRCDQLQQRGHDHQGLRDGRRRQARDEQSRFARQVTTNPRPSKPGFFFYPMNKLELVLINGDKIQCARCWISGNDLVYQVDQQDNGKPITDRRDFGTVNVIQSAE